MHPDQPTTGTVRRDAEKSLVIAVADALDAGLSPAEVQSAIAEGIATYIGDRKDALFREILHEEP